MATSTSRIDRPRPVPEARGAPSLRQARRLCAALARAHYENFPVASLLVPAGARSALQAIYAFARIADDYADEEEHAGDRLERLQEWEAMLEACFRGEAHHPVFVSLREAIERHALSPDPFRDLLAAFRMDVGRRRYPDFAALLEYCRLSANPIGRMMLHLFRDRDAEHLRMSDAICTALQLTNHWQDVAIDLRNDRIYLPAEDRARFGVTEGDLRAGRVTEGFRALMQEEIERTRTLFARGKPLCDAARGRLRLELRLIWLGGERILKGIETVGYDVFARRPRLRTADALRSLGRALVWTA